MPHSHSVVLLVVPLIFMGDLPPILDLGMFTALPMALDGWWGYVGKPHLLQISWPAGVEGRVGG